jgi:hypothetical protein
MSAFTDRMYILEYQEQMRQAEKRRKEREKEKNMEEREKKIKSIMRKKEQEKEFKEYEKTIVLSIKQDLRNEFEKEFELQGLKAKYYFFNIEKRNSLIKKLAKTTQEQDYLESNYSKILNEIIKKYELHEKYKEQETQEIIQEEIEKNRDQWEKEAKAKRTEHFIVKVLLFPIEHIFITLFVIIAIFFIKMFIEALGFGFFKAVIFGIGLEIFFIMLFLGFIK